MKVAMVDALERVTQYWLAVMNDAATTPARRDKAAAQLVSLLCREKLPSKRAAFTRHRRQ